MKSGKETSKFDTLVYTEGLPCHKFILKKLTTTNAAKVFTKNYVATMKAAGMEDDKIEESLLFFSGLAYGLNGTYDFASWDNCIDGFSLVNNILFDNSVAAYKKCNQYYKQTDVKCTACALCFLSSRYKNRYIDTEKALVQYALASMENLNYILDSNLSKDSFTSVMDVIGRKTVSTKPCLYPFYKHTFGALQDKSIQEDIFISGIDYCTVLSAYHLKKIKRLSNAELNAITKDCGFDVDTFCSVMVNEMLTGEVCTKEQVDSYLKQLIPPEPHDLSLIFSQQTPKDTGATIFENCNLGISGLSDFYGADLYAKPVGQTGEKAKQSFSKEGSQETKTDTVISESPVSDIQLVDLTLEDILSSINSTDTEYSENETFVEEELCEDTTGVSSNSDFRIIRPQNNEETVEHGKTEPILGHDVIPDVVYPVDTVNEVDNTSGFMLEEAHSAEDKPYGNPVISENMNTPVVEEDNETIDDTQSEQELFYPIPNSGMTFWDDTGEIDVPFTELLVEEELYYFQEKDLNGVPLIQEEELRYFALCLDNGPSRLLTMLESHVYKDKRLSLELVCTKEQDFYLLMYSPKLHAYFYTDCKHKDVLEIIAPLLSYSSIIKICYYPFALVSALRILGLQIKSIRSLFSMSRLLLGPHNMSMGDVLLDLGATPAEGGVTIEPVGEIKSVALLYMHCYSRIYHHNQSRILYDGLWNQFELFNMFDVALGLSYNHHFISHQNTLLFRLTTANEYTFLSQLPSQFKEEGKVFQLKLQYSPEENGLVILNLICDMYIKGLFFRTDTTLLSMGEGYVVFYVPERDAAYMETQINRLFLLYLQRTKLRGLEYSFEELKNK